MNVNIIRKPVSIYLEYLKRNYTKRTRKANWTYTLTVLPDQELLLRLIFSSAGENVVVEVDRDLNIDINTKKKIFTEFINIIKPLFKIQYDILKLKKYDLDQLCDLLDLAVPIVETIKSKYGEKSD